jgi:transcription elongation factor Elf1
MKKSALTVACLATFALLVACGSKGDTGPAGTDGTNGTDGIDGKSALFSTTVEPAGEHCPAGGLRLDYGVDTDGNGTLDSAEISGTSYLCNGSDAAQSLIKTTDEPAGTNCPNGGQRIDYGVDDDGDGALATSEIDGTKYVCNGATGDNGLQTLVKTTDEPAGANCEVGGQRIDYGVDDDGDGVLDTAEIDGTRYVCNGLTGHQTLLTTTDEPAGANCVAGGQRIDYGVDNNDNGTLDAAEIDGTTYVCNGQVGLQTLVVTTPEPAGANCVAGGQRIDYGLDDDRDGILDAAEIDGTTYVCDGQVGLQTLVVTTPEPAGANCVVGGQRIDYGLDDNRDGILDAAEVDGTAYACDGQDGLQTLVTTTPEPAGANCVVGGQRIDYGLDDNRNGTLDAAEIDGTVYACNGQAGLQSLVATTAEPVGAHCASGGQRIDYGLDDNRNGTLDPTEIDGTTYVCNGIHVDQKILNGDFANALTNWTVANNPTGGNDTTSTFYVNSGRLQNVASTGPSARVAYQDFLVPTGVYAASFTFLFAQDNGSALDPANVQTIVKDPFDAGGGGAQNAFRIDIISSTGDVFTNPILFELYAPTASVPTVNGTMTSVSVSTAALATFFQGRAGQTLRLRIGQVESTFPWTVQVDDVKLTLSSTGF